MVVAKRYAEGLFKLAVEEKKTEIFLEDLIKLYDLFKNNQSFVELLFDQKIRKSDKKKEIMNFLNDIKIDPYIKNLVCLLIDKEREVVLAYIPLYYKQLYDKMYGIVDVEVLVYDPIDEQMLDKIRSWLYKRYDIKKPVFNIKVDKSIVGGIKLIFNNIEVDATIKGAIDQIKKELIQKVV